MLLPCPAISLDLPAEWEAATQYLTQITSECQNILTTIFCWCRLPTQFLVFVIKNMTIVLNREKEKKKIKQKTPNSQLNSTVHC